ncbi:MAG: hypothetical protein IJU28_09155, partial [Clostridia bacterium]|nr:hypothetical protein [Clostridia bacterium]
LGPARAEIQEAWQLWETKQPTCTEQGYEVWYNLLTGEYQNRNFKPALGHNWSAWDIVQAATCTQKGLRTRYCQRCYIDEEQETPAAHDWGAWETDIPGTCIAQERLVCKCKRCGALDYWTKDYGDHDWGEWESVKAPTATEPGEEKRVCKNSPDHVETREIPAMGEETVNPGDEKPALASIYGQ